MMIGQTVVLPPRGLPLPADAALMIDPLAGGLNVSRPLALAPKVLTVNVGPDSSASSNGGPPDMTLPNYGAQPPEGSPLPGSPTTAASILPIGLLSSPLVVLGVLYLVIRSRRRKRS